MSTGRRVVPILAAVAVLGIVGWINGLFPGDSPTGAASYLTTGQIQCSASMGWSSLVDYCDALGIPQGFPYVLGLPWILFGALLTHLPGVGSFAAYLLIGWISIGIGLGGGCQLMRTLDAPWVIALITPAIYLCSPSVLGMSGFGPTWTGFVLLPFYTWVHVAVMNRLDGPGRIWPALVCLWPLSALAMFTDGYSFITGWLLAGCLWLAWTVRGSAVPIRKCLGLVCAAAAAGTAVLAYELYVPGGSFTPTAIDLFRAMGLDVVTLVAPTPQFWVWNLLGLDRDFSMLWGDGSNSTFNYVGVVMVGLAIGLFVVLRKRVSSRVVAFGVAAVLALLLSLGPSLKIDDARPAALESVVTYESYLMPADLATAGLPTEFLYAKVPGLSDVRATYRWFLLTRFCVIVLAGLAIAELARSGRRTTATVLAVIAILDTAPNLPLQARDHSAAGAQTAAVRTNLVPDFRSAVRPGERVLFLPAGNDFLADLLAPSADVASYNAGGDKNLVLAQHSWPAPVTAAVANFGKAGEADAIEVALQSGLVDAVVLPRFDLRWSSYNWPASAAEQAVGDAAAARLVKDPRFTLTSTEWFSVVRSAPAG